MKKYETYKDSGLEWLGMVPEHWKVIPIKYVLEQSNEGIKIGPFGSALTGKVSTEHPVRVYGQWNIVGKDFNAGKNFVTEETYHELSSYQISANDILISMMGTVGKCAIIPETADKGIMDSHIVKVRLDNSKILPKYFYYIYDKDCSKVIIEQIQCNKRGSIMDGLNSSLIKNFVITLPPLSEQRTIASYLDHKVGKIDALISEKEKMVEDLKAYRSSLITETVTKGLDKGVEMKDSSVEWIKKIPATWTTVLLKRCATIMTGGTPSTDIDRYWANPTFRWYTPSDFSDDDVVLNDSSRKLDETAIKEYAAKLFPKNSVLVVGIGATLGKVGISLNECSSNQQINAIIFNSTVLPEYGAYYLLAGKEYIKSQSNAATLPILNQSTMGELQIVVPNIEEQKNIVGFINKKVSVIKEDIENLQLQLSDLKSYKSSLITEAVTGKIDLRDWQTKKS